MTKAAMCLQSMQRFECLRKAANKQIGVNMHSGLKIDAIGMAFVAGPWGLYKDCGMQIQICDGVARSVED